MNLKSRHTVKITHNTKNSIVYKGGTIHLSGEPTFTIKKPCDHRGTTIETLELGTVA